jgi:hypothetical protein
MAALRSLSLVALFVPGVALAQPGAAPSSLTPPPAAEDEPEEVVEGFVLPPSAEATPPFVLMGYVDVGYAHVEGNGSSFPVGDTRLPVDYGVDTFAPMVNSRGDVASIEGGGLFNNGFLPRSVGIGGKPSFLLNTVNLDARYMAPQAPIMAFTRLQVLPRFGGSGRGNQTELLLEQAFGRVTPIHGTEWFISAGKFDSVFGIEYLENQANFRTGITPSLLARYTTGTSLGVKSFFRQQIGPLWSAVSLNVSATNSGSFVEALQPPDASLTGEPVVSARAGYELNLPFLQVKLGGSGMVGPRNDQRDPEARQTMYGFDGRIYIFGLSLSGEWVHVDEDAGAVDKQTGAGQAPIASGFHARGFWAQAAYAYPFELGALRAGTLYYRFERRHAWFDGFRPITVGRHTGGFRIDLWQSLILKAEVLLNKELEGAPLVDNDVITSSVVYTW